MDGSAGAADVGARKRSMTPPLPLWALDVVHNGLIRDFPQLKRDLVLEVDASLYSASRGRPIPRSCSSWR
jgi:hypothetical protein